MTLAGTSILALDLGSTTGFACKTKNGTGSGTVSFKKKGKWQDSGFKLMYEWLDGFDHHGLEIVVETPHGGYFNSMRILFGLLAIVHLWAGENNVPIHWVSPKSIKKYATGKGNADKKAMVAAIQSLYPYITDNNEADAMWLLRYHLEKK